MNAVQLIGRLTKDVELRATTNNNTVGNFTIAVERPFKDASGQKQTDFIRGIIWGKQATNFANFTGKGALVGIQGEIHTGQYTNQQGQTVYTTDVNVTNFTLLESREQREQRNGQTQGNGFTQPSEVQQTGFTQPDNQAPWNTDLTQDEKDSLPFEV